MPIKWTDNPEADALLEREPLALLIGLVLDQQVKMEKAFSGPYELQKRIGHLDARKIASMDPAELDRVIRRSLERDREKRYSDAVLFIGALEKVGKSLAAIETHLRNLFERKDVDRRAELAAAQLRERRQKDG